MTLTQNKIDRIIELWKELHNIAAIERILRIARNTVKKYLREKGYLRYSYRSSSLPYTDQTGKPHPYHSMTSTQRQQPYPQTYQEQTTYEYDENLAREVERENQELEQKTLKEIEQDQKIYQLWEKLRNAYKQICGLKTELNQEKTETKEVKQRVTHLIAEKEAEKRQKEEVQNTLYEYIKNLQDEYHKKIEELQHKMNTTEQQAIQEKNVYYTALQHINDNVTTLINEQEREKTINKVQADEIHTLKNELHRLESEKKNRGAKYVVVAIGGVIAGLIGGLAGGPLVRDWISKHLNQTRAQLIVYDGYPINNITLNQNQAISGWPVYGVDSLDYNIPDQPETNTRITMKTNASDTSYSGVDILNYTEQSATDYVVSTNKQNSVIQPDMQNLYSETPLAIHASGSPCAEAYTNSSREITCSGYLVFPNQQNSVIQPGTYAQGTSETHTPSTFPSGAVITNQPTFTYLPLPPPDPLTNPWYLQLLQKLKTLPGKRFEIYLKGFFEHRGDRVELTPETHDMGADLILNQSWCGTAVQIKQQKENIGIDAIQQVNAAKGYYHVPRALVICTTKFTSSALTLAQENDVDCWDGERLLQEIYKNRYFIMP